MGTARIYWYPEALSALQTIDLGEGLEDLITESVALGETGVGLGGAVYPAPLGHYESVRVVRGGLVDKDVYASLRTLERHTERGGLVGVSADHAKTWAGYSTRALVRGTTTIRTSGNAWAAYSSSGAVASGDYVVIESAWPDSRWEVAKVSSVSGSTITLSAGLKYTYRQQPVMIRWEGFYPILARMEGGPLVTAELGLIFRLDATFRTVPAATTDARRIGEALRDSTTDGKGGKTTLWDTYTSTGKDRGGGSLGVLNPQIGGLGLRTKG